jgi:copper transport protein
MALAAVLGIFIQAESGGGMLLSQVWWHALLTLALSTRLGFLMFARFAMMPVLVGLLIPPAIRWKRWVGFAVCLGLLLTFSLESHAAAEPRPLVPLLVDWIHFSAVSVWTGGLFCFLGGVASLHGMREVDRNRHLALLIPRFSTAALASVGVLGVSGIYEALIRVGTFDALIHTGYGQALVIKLLLFLLLFGLGAVNLLRISPRMRHLAQSEAVAGDLTAYFRRVLTAEGILAVILLLWAGVFTSLVPAQARSTPAGFFERTRADDLSISLNIDPGKVGINQFHAGISRGGLSVNDAQEVELIFDSYSGLVPGSKAVMQSLGNGQYTFTGGYLSLVDRWSVQVTVIRPDRFDAFGQFKIDLNPTPLAGPFPWWRLTAGMLIVCAFGYGLSARAMIKPMGYWQILGLLPGAAILLLGCWLIFQSAPPI